MPLLVLSALTTCVGEAPTVDSGGVTPVCGVVMTWGCTTILDALKDGERLPRGHRLLLARTVAIRWTGSNRDGGMPPRKRCTGLKPLVSSLRITTPWPCTGAARLGGATGAAMGGCRRAMVPTTVSAYVTMGEPHDGGPGTATALPPVLVSASEEPSGMVAFPGQWIPSTGAGVVVAAVYVVVVPVAIVVVGVPVPVPVDVVAGVVVVVVVVGAVVGRVTTTVFCTTGGRNMASM